MMEDREVLIKESILEDVGEAIQEKTKSSKKFLPDQLGDQIRGISNYFISSYKDKLGQSGNPNFFNFSANEVI